MQLDVKALGDMIADLIAEAVEPLEKANAELRKEIEALKAREPDRIETIVEAPPVEIDMADVVKELLASDGIKHIVGMEVAAYMAENPPPAGKDGRDGKDGEPGPRGEKGDPGQDGAGIADLLIDRDGNLVATFTDGRMKSLGVVVGKDGAPGAPGRDGADFSDASIDYDGERAITIKGRGGEIVKRVPVPLWRGYWSPGVVAEKGDILTHNGTAYIAIVDNPKCEPGVGKYDHEWKVFARRGRDGRDGRNGIDKTAPVKVTRDDG